MQKTFLRKIENLYKKSDQLLATGKFGEGLWPLHAVTGEFLFYLIRFFKLRKGIEVGAGVGYSSAWFAAALKETRGHLLSFEYYLPKVKQWEVHMKNLFGQNFLDFVTMVPSEFEKSMGHLKRNRGFFDFVFFDQRKEDYFSHLKLLLPSLQKGCFIAADNVISHQGFCQEYLEFVKTDLRFMSVTLPIGQGLEISRVL